MDKYKGYKARPCLKPTPHKPECLGFILILCLPEYWLRVYCEDIGRRKCLLPWKKSIKVVSGLWSLRNLLAANRKHARKWEDLTLLLPTQGACPASRPDKLYFCLGTWSPLNIQEQVAVHPSRRHSLTPGDVAGWGHLSHAPNRIHSEATSTELVLPPAHSVPSAEQTFNP